MDIERLLADDTENAEENRCVVRLTTKAWVDKRGINQRKSLTFLRRQSQGYNMLEADAEARSAEDVLSLITNLNDYMDGVYLVVICNEHRSYETGYLEDYDYRLVPYSI